MSKNISLIISGGTISAGYNPGGGFIDNNKTDILKLFPEIKFHSVTSPLLKLSENFGLSDVAALAREIDAQCNSGETDGVIVTLGTDTLAYIAPCLSVLLGDVKKPVMLVSSLLPLTDLSADGYKNMRAAADYINKFAHNGIFVPFLNGSGGDLPVHFAEKVLPIRSFEHHLSSMDGKIHGFFVSCSNYYDFLLKEKPLAAKRQNSSDSLQTRIERLLKSEKENNVFLIRPHLGFNYKVFGEFVNARDNAKVVIDAFHSGTVKTEGENNVNDIKVPVFITGGECGKAKYESLKSLNANIKTVDGITAAALYYEMLAG